MTFPRRAEGNIPLFISPSMGLRASRWSGASAITAVVAVAWLLAGTRWASYVGVEPLFLTDIFVGLALANAVVRSLSRPSFGLPVAPQAQASSAILALVLLVCYVAIRAISGIEYGLTSARDAVPYIYAVLGIVAYKSSQSVLPAARRRTAEVLLWALRFHAAWFVLVIILLPDLPESLPLVSAAKDLHIFSIRGDVDTALAGVYSALLLRNILLLAHHPRFSFVGFVVLWFAILQTGSRAGLFGAATACLVLLIFAFSSRSVQVRRKTVLVGLSPILVISLLAAFPSTSIGQRVLSTFGMSTASNIVDGAGTAGARAAAWDRLLDYSLESAPRFVVGVGFGPDFMIDSGAGYLLVGEGAGGTTRSPHNYWIGTLSRLGIIGLAGVFAVMLSLVLLAWRARRHAMDEPLHHLVLLIPLSLVVPATLGVVLESPFGAVPFFWCIGVAAALGSKLASAETRNSARPSSKADGEPTTAARGARSLD